MLLTLLLALAGQPFAPPSTSPTSAPAGPAPAVGAPESPTADAPKLTVESVATDDGLRWYRLYSPPDPAPGELLPVVVAFHGGGGNATHAIASTGIAEEAARRGWYAVFPEGSGPLGDGPKAALKTWNAGNCCAFAGSNDADDVGFFGALLDELLARAPVDPERVFVTGMSNGAMMAYRLGVELPERVAAIAPVAGALGVGPPRAPVPILAIHGALDMNVPFEGGVGGGVSGTDFTSQLDSILPFLAVNGGPLPGPPIGPETGKLFVSAAPPGGADTWYYLALDGGHSWPGGNLAPVQRKEPVHTAVPATRLMFEFFLLQ